MEGVMRAGEGWWLGVNSMAPLVVWLPEPLTGGFLHDTHLTGACATCRWTSAT
jgi:hypothetical protein